jgi:hypothetical protein
MAIYKKKNLLQPTFFQRLFKKQPEENVLIEINNILAENESNILNISLDKIVELADKYNVNISDEDHLQRLDLFEDYLIHCLSDKKIEDLEIKELEHLKALLFLSDKDLTRVISRETEKIYSKSVKESIKDGEIDNSKRENLERLKSDLLIPDDLANEIFQENAKEVYQKLIDGTIEDYSLSPDEEAYLDRIGKNLGIDPKYSDKKKQTLEKYKIYWQIENADLPVLETDINLQKSETLHFKTSVNWLEQRRVTKRINYGGPTARIKIMKGVYYRAGSIGVQRVSEDVWQTIDSGTIYLTSKRLIFMGYKGNKTITIGKILDFKPYNNGVEIQKDAGKSPFLEFDKGVDIFSMILVRLMKN